MCPPVLGDLVACRAQLSYSNIDAYINVVIRDFSGACDTSAAAASARPPSGISHLPPCRRGGGAAQPARSPPARGLRGRPVPTGAALLRPGWQDQRPGWLPCPGGPPGPADPVSARSAARQAAGN